MESTTPQAMTLEYEAPRLVALGSVTELTEWCFFGKNLGDPDYFNHIPISNCSS